MHNLRTPIPTLTTKERNLGLGYLLFQLLILPGLLALFYSMLPYPIGPGLLNFLFFAINAIAVGVIFHRLLRKSVLRFCHAPKESFSAAGVGLILYWISMSSLSVMVALFFPGFVNLNDSNITNIAADQFWLTAIGAVLLVPLAEETMHRGLVFGLLYPRYPTVAYFVSAGIFSLIHVLSYIGLYEPLFLLLAFVVYLPAGAVLAYAYRRSGTLLAPMLIHAAVNAMGILSMR